MTVDSFKERRRGFKEENEGKKKALLLAIGYS